MNILLTAIRTILLGAALMAAGCATPAQPTAMVAAPAMGTVQKSSNGLGIQVAGGQQTSSVGASQISNEGFERALELSIGRAGLFAAVGLTSNARYQLNAYITRVSQPLFGFSMTVTLEVSYTLIDTQSHKTVWQKAITSEHTASAGDAFAGVTRLRLATEGAAQQNIEFLLRELSSLKLE